MGPISRGETASLVPVKSKVTINRQHTSEAEKQLCQISDGGGGGDIFGCEVVASTGGDCCRVAVLCAAGDINPFERASTPPRQR